MFFNTVFLLCLQTWLIWVWAFSAGTKSSQSVQFIDAQTFYNMFVHSHVFMNKFSKSMAVTWCFFSGNFRSLWSCFLSIVIAILKTRYFWYLHQILTKLCSLLILLSVIFYQLSFVCYCHLFHLLIFFFFISSMCSSWLSNRSINIKHIINIRPVF